MGALRLLNGARRSIGSIPRGSAAISARRIATTSHELPSKQRCGGEAGCRRAPMVPERYVRRRVLGSDAVYRVIRLYRSPSGVMMAVLEVVDVPGLERGTRLTVVASRVGL